MSKAIRSKAAKALVKFMSESNDDQIRLEWEISSNTKPATKDEPNRKVWSHKELKSLYGRESYKGRCGASKVVHTDCHNGEEFKCIVVKRHQYYGYIDEHQFNPDYYHTGNQLVDEIRCWERFAATDESDYLCPILKYFTSKSDRVSPISEKMQENVLIISQKAIYVRDCLAACQKAAQLNGESDYWDRYYEMEEFSNRMGWRDAMDNPGNSGVIYDYSQNRYKAVFIDYAL